MTALPGQLTLGAGRSVLAEFTAVGSTAAPASVTFQDAASGLPAQSGSVAGRAGSGWASRTGWPSRTSWPGGTGWPGWWRGAQQNGYGGWPAPSQGGWPGGVNIQPIHAW